MKTFTKIFSLGLIVSALFLSGCYSAKQAYQSGNYEQAVSMAVKKLRKNKGKEKQIAILEDAYNTHVQNQLDAIEYLKLEGNPDCWVKIYEHYTAISRVQNLVKPLIPLYLESEFRDANIKMMDVNAEIVNAKQKAAEYMYVHASGLLAKGDKINSRNAYYEFIKVKEFYQNFRDIDQKIDEAYASGQSYVMINLKNTSAQLIPVDFETELKRINLAQVNSIWVKYYTTPVSDVVFDYDLVIHVRDINIAPEQVIEKHFDEKRTIQDGWEYVLDANGNVAKDTSGNDIKKPLYKTIVAHLTETQQRKSGHIAGSFDYFNRKNQQMIKSVPFSEVLGFEHGFLSAAGNLKALTPETKKRLGGGPVPFPSNQQMLLDASSIVRNRLSASVKNEVGIVMN